MIDFSVAYEKLASLDCADEIASFLQSQGVEALRGEPQKCAIAQWISDTTGISEVYVDYISIDHWEEEGRDFQSLGQVTPAMLNFITAFDEGKYPDLVLDWVQEGD